MLKDPNPTLYHENIALTLGMIGSESAVDPLISYVSASAEGPVSRQAYKGRVGALVGLGYILNRSSSEKALSFLMQSASPDSWERLEAKGVTRPKSTIAETARDLSKYAIIGLGLSGNPKAAEYLQGLYSHE